MLALAVAIGVSCASEPLAPAGTPVVEQRYEANGTVLDDGGGPELCLGGIRRIAAAPMRGDADP